MIRMKMEPAERAKQFMPFAALKGYEEALRAKEKSIVPKPELSEESLEKLEYKLRQVKKNDKVTVVYFCEGEYLKITGTVSYLNLTERVIRIENVSIPFDNLYDISGEKIREVD